MKLGLWKKKFWSEKGFELVFNQLKLQLRNLFFFFVQIVFPTNVWPNTHLPLVVVETSLLILWAFESTGNSTWNSFSQTNVTLICEAVLFLKWYFINKGECLIRVYKHRREISLEMDFVDFKVSQQNLGIYESLQSSLWNPTSFLTT